MTSPQSPFQRAIVIVMDSVGVGELPDAASYGDQGSNTVGNIAKQIPLRIPTLRSLGLDRLVQIDPNGSEGTTETAKFAERSIPKDLSAFSAVFASSAVSSGTLLGAYGRMAEASKGKDSVTGHWEMMGIVLDRAFPTFPNGFDASSHRGVLAAHGQGRHRQQGGIRHGDHRRARSRAHAHRRADRLHVRRQRVSDRGARRSRPDSRALS